MYAQSHSLTDHISVISWYLWGQTIKECKTYSLSVFPCSDDNEITSFSLQTPTHSFIHVLAELSSQATRPLPTLFYWNNRTPLKIKHQQSLAIH